MTKVNDALLNVARSKNRAYALLDNFPWVSDGTYTDKFHFLRELYGSELSDSQLLNLFVEQYAKWERDEWEASDEPR